ncbi:MAG: hypothetical protein QXF25_00010 [Candidatus Pacearchaeota archaeon]
MQKLKIITIVFSIILAGCIVSAGFFDFLGGITGRATSQPTNVSVAVAGTTQCQVVYVSQISATNPIEASSTTITFNVHIYDQDGMNDINKSSVFANFTYDPNPNEYRTTVSNCTWVNNIPPRTANFSCSIDMWYWDGAGQWNINVRGNDYGNKTPCYNTTTNFQYNQLKAMVISPDALTWPTVSSNADNQTSNNDPTIINNTGNYDGTIDLTAIDLYGETNPSEYIPANNFTVGLTTGAENPECLGTILSNGTAATITGSNANRGNLSAGGGAGQEEFYYCIPKVPLVSSQVYSTLQGGSWIVSY